MRKTNLLPLLQSLKSHALSSSNIPLRKIKVDLQPHLPHSIIAYERGNLEDDELLERALGSHHDDGSDGRQAFHDTLGFHAWPSGFVAARKLLEMLPPIPKRKEFNVLELGCGTGIPSLAAYTSGATVTATDLDVDLISQSFREQKHTINDNTFQCIELDLLDKRTCERLIHETNPNVIIAADCLYDATLAKAVGQTVGMAVERYQCCVLVADPGRLNGVGRELFLDGFFDELSKSTEISRDFCGFENVNVPQESLKASGASLSWCGVLETNVGIFTWP